MWFILAFQELLAESCHNEHMTTNTKELNRRLLENRESS